MRKIPLHIKIIIGLVLGLLYGIVSIWFGWSVEFTIHYIKPFGTIFVNSLKMIAVPLVLSYLIVGVANLGDISRLSKMGGKTVVRFFDGLNDVIIQLVTYIMMIVPYCVFALIASLIVELAGTDASKAFDLLYALLWYSITVLLGLGAMVALVYPAIFKIFTKTKYLNFFRGIRPVQLLAFSTSSSSATLPITMNCVEPRLCNRISITSLTHFKSVALLCLSSYHSGAMLSKPNCLIYCDLKPHHEPYRIIEVEKKE